MNCKVPYFWYENEAGEKCEPDPHTGIVPEGFIYQHSRFPLRLRREVQRMVIQEEVDFCSHPDTKPDFGIIDSMEGRECLHCHGYQSKQRGEPWPIDWRANGSRLIFAGNSSANDELVTRLVRAQGMNASQAILMAAVACERCLNVMAYEAGLQWGYSADSEEAKESRTKCELCRT